ncbi:hypothetical protein DFJ58DRAFT_757263 [Suillus subalutaceus]|uniref:uncharacterized protein n=1 Tax=Suillus subalutaceus TaxID=48586 RepID=UPI001B868439|nr:uncharacterized protein DFJ58DRAFT_757263 [Suillus subalutaceus]KAG1875649.1 hypothetical protein DFJ58DRAFT_757263 [Suillus subalutaceus]
MAIRRSNTAPQSLEHQVRPGLARAKSAVDGFIPRLDQTSVPASSHHSLSAFVATAASPRDRKDPFSLTDFFPASYLSSPGEHWEWLRQEQTFEPGVDGSLPDTPGPVMFARGAEDEIEQTIKGEDKMGVLSVLNTIFLTEDGEDESIDHESLYLAIGRLGQAAESSGSTWWPIRWALHAMSSIV